MDPKLQRSDEQIMDLVEQALERPSADRRAFLEKACVDDTSLFETAWEYVQREERLGDFLQEPLIAPAPDVQNILHYEVVGLLGHGGQAKVYRAWDKNLKRFVALKYLPPHLRESGTEHERFLREATSIAGLDHPNIATVHAIEETSNGLFIVMPCYEGESLRDRIKRGPMGRSEAVGLALQIARGLNAAHAAGVVHRDLKPSNVIVTNQGVVKIIDFGIAKVAGDTRLTETGMRIGTIAYMSPEQAMGDPTDHRTDLWALGVVLHEMLTGEAPFHAQTAQKVVHAILNKPAAELPYPDIDVIVQRLLEKHASDRYQTAGEVVEQLELVQTGQTHFVTKTTLSPPRRRKLRRPAWVNRKLGVIAAIVVVLAGGAMGIRKWHATATTAKAPGNAYKQLAVLPLRNIGSDDDLQVLIDGLTETFTTALMRQPGLSVIPPTDSRKLQTAADARREFGVQLVISGSMQKRGDKVRLVLGLVDAESERQLDAQVVELPASQVPGLENGAVVKLADMLSVAIGPQMRNLPTAPVSASATAYEAYIRGRGYMYRVDIAGNSSRARDAFDQAVHLDPNFTAAQAGLAEALRVMYRNQLETGLLESALHAATRAVELDPKFAAGHRELGAVYRDKKDFARSEKELEMAMQLDPQDTDSYRELAIVYQEQRKFAQAEQVYQRAVTARPGDWLTYGELGRFYRSRQRYKESVDAYRKVTELAPDSHIGYRDLGVALFSMGETKESEAMLRKALELRPASSVYNNLGAVLMFEKHYAEAVPVMEKAVTFAPLEIARSYRVWGNLGDAYWLSHGDFQKAKSAWLKAADIVQAQLVGNAGDAERLALQANYFAKTGDKDRAMQKIESAIKYASDSATVRYQAAIAYTILGQNTRALSELQQAISLGYSTNEIRNVPELDPLRNEPNYQQLIQTNSGR